jgi:hypothetical protein
LKKLVNIFITFFVSLIAVGQISPVKVNGKWGFTKDGAEFLPAKYDTVIAFDSVKKVCMACIKTQKPSPNKFIKMNTTTTVCKYINERKEELVIKVKNDTCSYFNFTKAAVANYGSHRNCMIVTSSKDGKKYAVDNNFKQIIFTGYDEIIPLSIKDHYMVENKTTGASYLNGVVDKNEKMLIPMEYTHIKSNPFDTLFITCTAQIRINGQDDVYNLEGKKIYSYNRHVDNATKNFIIHKVFEPTEHYIILDLKSNKEKNIFAEDITYLGNDMVNIKIKGKYNKCNLFELDTYKFLNHE